MIAEMKQKKYCAAVIKKKNLEQNCTCLTEWTKNAFIFNVTEDICQEIKQQGMMGKQKMTMPLSNWTKKQPEFSTEV